MSIYTQYLYATFQKYQLTPDKEFVKNLLMGASSWNFEFLTTIMELISDKEITPDDEFYKLLSHKLKVSKQKLVAQVKEVLKFPIENETELLSCNEDKVGLRTFEVVAEPVVCLVL